ncbi:MAG: GldG family protein [Verrucomicrobiota bacterium]
MAEPTSTGRRLVISANVLVQILAVLALVVMANWLVSRHYSRFDWTKSGYYKVSDKTHQALGALKEPVKVIVYLQPSAESDLEEKIFQDVRHLLTEFKFYGQDKLQIEYVDPDRDLARAKQVVEKYKFDVREPALVIFACGTRNKYVGKDELVEMETGMGYGAPPRIKAFKAEGAFLSAIQTVTEGEPPAIYFLTGHGERDPESFDQRAGYSTLATYIKRDNLKVAKWNWQEQQALPTNANAIVIAGPRTKFSVAEQTVLDQYLKNRGRLLVMLDPKTESGLETFLKKWGVQVDDNLVGRKVVVLGTEQFDVNAIATTYAHHPVTAKLTDVNTEFLYCRSVRQAKTDPGRTDQPRVTELATASAAFWGKADLGSNQVSKDPFRDIAGPLSLAVAVETGQPRGADVDLGETRMIVVGTASFVDNSVLTAGNLDFFMSGLNWLLKREQLLAVGPKVPEEFRLDISPNELNAVYALTIAGLPLLVGIIGLSVWLRRRK